MRSKASDGILEPEKKNATRDPPDKKEKAMLLLQRSKKPDAKTRLAIFFSHRQLVCREIQKTGYSSWTSLYGFKAWGSWF